MAGFYRIGADGALERAENGLATPTGTYVVAQHDSYHYPLPGGWRYYVDEQAALAGLAGSVEIVTRVQARLALLEAGLLDRTEALIAQAPRATQIWYADAAYWRRDSPHIAALAPALGLDNAAIDVLFARAALIQ